MARMQPCTAHSGRSPEVVGFRVHRDDSQLSSINSAAMGLDTPYIDRKGNSKGGRKGQG
jgi:hypothetical protein